MACGCPSVEIDATMSALLGMSFDRRVAHPCIGQDRADLVLPGCAIFEAIRREWPTDRVRVADRGLREGILISLIDADRGSRASSAKETADGQGTGRRPGRRIRHDLKVRVKTSKGRKIGSTLWLQRQLNDPYVAKARAEGLSVARRLQDPGARRALQPVPQGPAHRRSRRRPWRLVPGRGPDRRLDRRQPADRRHRLSRNGRPSPA